MQVGMKNICLIFIEKNKFVKVIVLYTIVTTCFGRSVGACAQQRTFDEEFHNPYSSCSIYLKFSGKVWYEIKNICSKFYCKTLSTK